MTLVPKIFRRSQLHIDALGLEDDSDLAAQLVGFPGDVVSHDEGAPANRDHQGGKNSKQSSLAAAIWTEQAEQFCMAHFERNPVQSRTAVVAVHQILDGNDSRCGDGHIRLRAVDGVCGYFGGHRLFYDETLLS